MRSLLVILGVFVFVQNSYSSQVNAGIMIFHLFFNQIFTFSMLLAIWLILLGLGCAHLVSEMANVGFSFVFIIFCIPPRDAARWRQI